MTVPTAASESFTKTGQGGADQPAPRSPRLATDVSEPVRGRARSRPRAWVRGIANWPLALAVAVLVGLWAGPLTGLSGISFTAHMALHLGLVLIAAPLLALGLARLGAFRGVRLGAGAALAFAAVEMLAVWAWHAPAMHAAAALRDWAFVLQQASFLGAGLLVWLPGLSDPGRAAAAAGALAMAASFTHMTMLGVLLAVAPGLVYPDGICGGAFGLDPLSDQRVGGALMALGGGLVYLCGALWFTARLIDGTADR